MMKLIDKIDYLRDLDQNILQEIYYSLRPVLYTMGSHILKTFDQCNKIIFVEYGELEVYTKFENNDGT